MLCRLLVISIFTIITASCGQPSRISYGSSLNSSSGLSLNGFLAANTCTAGESLVYYQDRPYIIGSKSNSDINNLILQIQNNQYNNYLVSEETCQKVFKINFNGEFEKETNVLGNNGSETQDVIQVYQYQLVE